MPTTPPLLIFAGSTRQGSYNRRLAHEAARLARLLGASVTLAELADYEAPLYNADQESGQGTPEAVLRFKALLWQHPAWVICSPEYNASYTALLKNTIDWASSPVKSDPAWTDGYKSFRGKVVGLLSASPGAMGGLRSLDHLAPLLLNLQCWVAPERYALGRAGEAFDADGHLASAGAQAAVTRVLQQVLWAAGKLQGGLDAKPA